MITFLTDNVSMPPLNVPKTIKWMQLVAANYGFVVGNLNYIFCDDDKILQVNQEFLQHDYYTDVITFDYSTSTVLSGDVFISLDTVRSNAQMVADTFERELDRILIHALLHLTGQGDKTPETKQVMTQKEEQALVLRNQL
ncbi:MAG: rRNA maturation RNase YbeY [Paludibacteraceae bacterium]|nr:rRNA maturation RNase YbeY [Paludibacteraceae bacterium]